MGKAYFYNLTDQPVTAMLNQGPPPSQKTMTPISKDSSTGNYSFSSVQFDRDSDPQPRGKFGSDNKVTLWIGDSRLRDIVGVKDCIDPNQDILVFVHYNSIVVMADGETRMYTPAPAEGKNSVFMLM